MSKIKQIKAREILDSRGRPTIEVDLMTDLGIFRASVPAGVSRGENEAVELRDGGERHNGMGVLRAVKNVNEIISPELAGKDPTKQEEIDDLMRELDGTDNKSKLGANAILAVSIAVCRAGAAAENLPLYYYLNGIANNQNGKINELSPAMLMIEGGLHAGNDLDIQEFMILGRAESFRERLEIGIEIYHTLGAILKKRHGEAAANVGYEGGFAPPLKKTEEALSLIMEAVEKAGFRDKAKIILDAAASTFYRSGTYHFEEKNFASEDLLNFYLDLIKKYPILAIEDPFAQNDWQSWKLLTSTLNARPSAFLVIGDDLTVTNPKRIKEAKEKEACNAIIVKPNQIGTVSETIEAVQSAREAGWEIFIKHRSGETNDSFIADLAVGLEARYIMAGAPTRGERVAKYNRLLRIEENLKSQK